MPSLRYGVSVTPATGGGWTATFLKDFGYGQGGPTGLILDADGNLCFGTAGGGASGGGAVFELMPQAGGGWSEKQLHQFGQGTDGLGPNGSLVFDSAGNLYGATYGGGAYGGGLGTVFKLTPGANGVWTEKVLHSFGSNSTDGTHPLGNLIFDAAGNL